VRRQHDYARADGFVRDGVVPREVLERVLDALEVRE
jgi:hypothetical protein